MPQSLSINLVHLIYSTKNRGASLAPAIRPKLYAYQSGIFRECNSPAVVIGGTPDHVHALLRVSGGATEGKEGHQSGSKLKGCRLRHSPGKKRLRSVFRERVAGRPCATVYRNTGRTSSNGDVPGGISHVSLSPPS